MSEKSNYLYQIAPPPQQSPRFRRTAIHVARSSHGGWLTISGDKGWLHGDRRGAVDDAFWMSRNLGLPILERLA